MRKSYVYKITCKITGEFYFGSSFNAKRDYYWGSGRIINERISKYGKENFVKEILGEFYDRTESHRVENEYIDKFRHDEKCLNERIDYHFGLYGEESRAKIGAANRGKHLSEETRAKLSAALRGKFSGKHLSEETRAKMSAAKRGKHLSKEHRAKLYATNRGKTFSDETRAKMSAAHRGEKNPWYGKHRTDETRAKISAANRGKLCGKHWRKNPVTGKREYYD